MFPLSTGSELVLIFQILKVLVFKEKKTELKKKKKS